MAQFSLSPAVTVKEINATGYVPNIPSAKTGMVLRADQGPCLDITAITSENDLINVFGKPNSYNYQDWFQAWNFLQYASSLYVVRPMDANTATKNAGIGITGSDGASQNPEGNLYNTRVAEHTLGNFSDSSETLYFFNRDVTSEQKYAIGICSSPQYFKSPIGLEYAAIVNTTDGTETVVTAGSPSLTNGSQVIMNGDKLATVVAVTQSSSAASTVKFDRPVSDADVAPFYGVIAVSAASAATGTPLYFKKAGFTFREGASFDSDTKVVYSIANDPDNADNYLVTILDKTTKLLTSIDATAGQEIYSSTMEFFGSTAYNITTNDFGIAAGATTISLQNPFMLEVGVQFDIDGDTSVTGCQVASVDKANNTITLVSPVASAVTSATSIALTVASPTQASKLLVGINYFDKVYDSGLILKTRKSVTKPASGNTEVPVTVVAQSLVPFNKLFEYPPNYANGEFATVVLKKNTVGLYEKFETVMASYNSTAKNVSGYNMFVDDVFFKTSKSLYAKLGNADGARVDTAPTTLPKILADTSGGTSIYPNKTLYGGKVYDPSAYTQGDIMQAMNMFADPETFDINILMCHELDINGASTICETRKDCAAVVAPYDSQFLSINSNNDCTEYLLDNFGSQTEFDGKIFTAFGTYTAIYGNMKYQYDKFNNVNRWINVAGDVAGLYAQTDSTNDPWWAPAGTTRGIIRNAIKLAFNPNKQNRDELYVNSINPIMAIAGQGSAVVWGQKTATATPSAFDRVNVRRLLIHLEKSIATAVNIGLFEFNDTFTRTRLFNIIDPFLRSVQNRRGLYAYKVVIDASNNTNEVIDQNGLVIDIYLQPTKVAEFIAVNVIVTPTGSTFSEYVGSF